MKTFIIGLTFCIILTFTRALHLDHKYQLHTGKTLCIAEIGIDEKIIDDALAGGEINRDDQFDCFGSCVLKHMKLQRPDGTFDFELAHNMAVKSNVNIAQYDAVVQKCKNVDGENICNKAGNLFECFVVNHNFPV